MNPEQTFLKALPPEFQSHRPKVRFFEKAVPDKELTERDGRPRFKVRVYIEKIPAASNYAGDIFHAPMNQDHKIEYPNEWEKFLELRERVANRKPSLMAIPGMDVASYEELKALELWDCELLANHSGPLGELERFRTIARKIMEISNEIPSEAESSERQAVRCNSVGPAHNHLSPVSSSTGTEGFANTGTTGRTGSGGETSQKESSQKEGGEKGIQKEGFQKIGDFDLSFEVR